MKDTYSPIHELCLLKDIDDRLGSECYADGFAVTDDGMAGVQAGWSADPAFTGRLIPFAQANGSGSIYALWRADDRTDLASLPVVVFGDEGGHHVVARGLRELFRLLGFDSEVSVDWDSAYYYRGDDQEDSEGHAAFVDWLKGLCLDPARDPDAIVAAAQAEYEESFVTWCDSFLNEGR